MLKIPTLFPGLLFLLEKSIVNRLIFGIYELKIQKLERQRLAAERRRQSPKQVMKPSDLPKIELPNYIERGPSEILRSVHLLLSNYY